MLFPHSKCDVNQINTSTVDLLDIIHITVVIGPVTVVWTELSMFISIQSYR